MLADPDESIRNAAVDKIVHIRNHGAKATDLIEEGSKNLTIRRFEVTQINCKAQSHHNIANIDAEKDCRASTSSKSIFDGNSKPKESAHRSIASTVAVNAKRRNM